MDPGFAGIGEGSSDILLSEEGPNSRASSRLETVFPVPTDLIGTLLRNQNPESDSLNTISCCFTDDSGFVKK